MQLSQPIRAKHNGYARKSSLDFVLENLDTIPPEKGILNTTRRLNEKYVHLSLLAYELD